MKRPEQANPETESRRVGAELGEGLCGDRSDPNRHDVFMGVGGTM